MTPGRYKNYAWALQWVVPWLNERQWLFAIRSTNKPSTPTLYLVWQCMAKNPPIRTLDCE